MKSTRFTLALTVATLAAISVRAELKPAAIFGDNMVLQQEQKVPVWGWAAPGAKVTVTFAGQTKTTKADQDGKWLVKLGKLKASFEPKNILIEAREIISPAITHVADIPSGIAHGQKTTGGTKLTGFEQVTTKTFTNILVGEVWLASGQSNMEKPIGKQPGQRPTFNADEELAAANYPNIRLFKIEKELAAKPLDDLRRFQGWAESSSNSLNTISFSAAAYFFGQMIHTNLNVPVGLIESSWGGTRIEPWTPPVGFKMIPKLATFADQPDPGTNKLVPTRPMAIYNAMIAPIVGYAIRGALWYQGESNLNDTNAATGYKHYNEKMQAMVGGWREIWGEGAFPFYFVQIAPFKYFTGKTVRAQAAQMLPEFWTVQSKAAREIKNAGMVVTTDLVDDLNDIHPRNKKAVGQRLALLALDKTYDREVDSESPVFDELTIKGDKIIVEFDEADGGLKSRDGQPLTWFEIAGADGKFFKAEAKIIGKDEVEVSSPEVKSPKAVRFAWDETAMPNLCNGAGLPAEPFRSDQK